MTWKIPGILLFLISMLAACSTQVNESEYADRLTINNDPAELAARITYFDDVDVDYEAEETAVLHKDAKKKKLKLKLRAEVEAPVVDGHVLHASHVTFSNHHAYVSYSTQEGEYRGAVEIIDVMNITKPELVSQALFRDTDITIAVEYEGSLFLGEATRSDSNEDFESPACLEVIPLRKFRMTDNTTRFDLPSYNANDMDCFDDAVFITSGTTDGALSIFDFHSLELSQQIPIHGAKAVAKSRDYIIVMEGTGSRLHLFDRGSRAQTNTIEIGCSSFFQNKAEISVAGDKVYLSAWRCGVKAVDLASGRVEHVLDAPVGGQTNGVSVSDSLMFVANGQVGVWMVLIEENHYCIKGRIKFDGSTNYVAVNEDQLFVANGYGGLKILQVMYE